MPVSSLPLRPLPLRFGLAGCALVLVIAGTIWWGRRDDGRLHLIVPELPGDGILIRSGGMTALVDGGADGAELAHWLGTELGLAERRIDLLIQTRADETTLPGQLATVRRYAIGQALLIQPATPHPLWTELVRILREQRVPIRMAHIGEQVRLGSDGQGATPIFEVLSAGATNATYELRLGSQRVLLLQSLGEGPMPPAAWRGPALGLVYPWRRALDDPQFANLAPTFIVFGEQPSGNAQLTLAERRLGSATLLHEALSGQINLAIGPDGVRVQTARRQGN